MTMAKTSTERVKAFRERQRAKRQPKKPPKTDKERWREYRRRKNKEKLLMSACDEPLQGVQEGEGYAVTMAKTSAERVRDYRERQRVKKPPKSDKERWLEYRRRNKIRGKLLLDLFDTPLHTHSDGHMLPYSGTWQTSADSNTFVDHTVPYSRTWSPEADFTTFVNPKTSPPIDALMRHHLPKVYRPNRFTALQQSILDTYPYQEVLRFFCYECRKTFSNNKNLLSHIAVHISQPLIVMSRIDDIISNSHGSISINIVNMKEEKCDEFEQKEINSSFYTKIKKEFIGEEIEIEYDGYKKKLPSIKMSSTDVKIENNLQDNLLANDVNIKTEKCDKLEEKAEINDASFYVQVKQELEIDFEK